MDVEMYVQWQAKEVKYYIKQYLFYNIVTKEPNIV